MPRGFFSFVSVLALCVLLVSRIVSAQSTDAGVDAQLRELIEQNRKLQAQLETQQKMIDELKSRVDRLHESKADVTSNQSSAAESVESSNTHKVTPFTTSGLGIRLSGEGGFAFFKSGSKGSFPNSEFRVDEARLYLDAAVWKDIYFYTEFDLYTRESTQIGSVGELYVDVENLSRALGVDELANLRVGQFYTPFGEEYQNRSVLTNPLITHSLSDIWGDDVGAEIYGRVDRFHYAVAVQNGGGNPFHDYNSDKAVSARIAFDALSWLRVSASAMRTGYLTTPGDRLSAIWFGNGFFRTLGANATSFQANLFELDAATHWNSGHLSGFIGQADYKDNDRGGGNARTLKYGAVEGVQDITEEFYGALRYSRISAPNGYPLVGLGTFGNYFYSPLLTESLWRLSFGLGYRFAPSVVLKAEYSYERGKLTTGTNRDHENLWSTEFGVKF